MALDLSVIVPIYGPSARLRTLLESLDRQTLSPDRFEVVVVDDGSPEPIVAYAADYGFSLTLVRQENTGPAGARNRAIELARAPLTLILNDDAVPADDLLETHLALQAEAPERVAVLGTFPFTAAALESPFVQLLHESDLLFDVPRLRSGEFYGWGFFWTCNLSLPTGALRAVGGFDAENFPHPVMEDVELGYRLEQQGWRVWYREEAKCEHDHVLTHESFFRRMEQYGESLVRMWRKHEDPAILGVGDSARVEPAFQQLQLQYEMLRPTFMAAHERWEKLERAFRGSALPPQVRDEARRLLAKLRVVPMARGIARARYGRDAEEVAANGPAHGALTSVVFASKDARDKTRDCVEALRASHDSRFPIEMIAVDNGSTDGSAEYLAEQSDIQLIRNEENLGAPHARNQALRHARGEWIVFMDNDVVVFPGWLERLRHHGEIDPGVGCVVPVSNRAAHGQQVEAPADRSHAAMSAFAAERAAACAGRARYKQVFSSLCVLVRRDVIDRIGGFDERFSPWGFEDDDFSLRVALAGFRTRLAQDVFVHHAHYGGQKAAWHEQLLKQNWQRFAEKWGNGAAAEYGDYAFLGPVMTRPWQPDALHVPYEAGSEA